MISASVCGQIKYCVSPIKQNNKMAHVLSGKEVSSDIKEQIKNEVTELQSQFSHFLPGLAIVQVGNRDDSNVYVRQILISAVEVGVRAEHIKLARSSTESEVLACIDRLNNDTAVHGIIVLLPLDSENTIDLCLSNAVLRSKDVEGLHEDNIRQLRRGQLDTCIIPCTPKACMELIKRTGVDITGKRTAVLGYNDIVGYPLSYIFVWNYATVAVSHSKVGPEGLKPEVSRADILVVGMGRPELIRGDLIKPGAVVIDCGWHLLPDATKRSGYRLVGDVHYPSVKEVAAWITPVLGGVGPVTVAMLLRNTVDQARKILGIAV